MAVYKWSEQASGTVINFNPAVDVFQFDDPTIHAADVTMSSSQGVVDNIFHYQGKTVTLTASSHTLGTSNVVFTDGGGGLDSSRYIVGDNSTALNDDGPNTITGGSNHDFLIGGGGSDTI